MNWDTFVCCATEEQWDGTGGYILRAVGLHPARSQET